MLVIQIYILMFYKRIIARMKESGGGHHEYESIQSYKKDK